MRLAAAFTTMVLLSLSISTLQGSEIQPKCVGEEKGISSLTLSLSGWKNSTGEWETELTARKEVSNSSKSLSVEVAHQIFGCNGKTVITLKGYGGGRRFSNTMGNILFNNKCGKNAVIINNGRSAFRMNPDKEDGHAILLTSRPLHDNELFEVQVESKITKWGGHSMGVGITSISIDTFSPPLWMMEVKTNTWMMYDADTYVDGKKKTSGYGKNLANLKAKDRVGVMRSDSGNLHIFVNGIDQGIAESNIPASVHGVIDIIRDTVSVSIV